MIESLVSGKLHGKPMQRTSKTGRPFVTAKMRVATGADESHFVNVTAFSDSAQAALLALDDGDGVAVAGSLNVGMWTTREGVAAPSLSIIAAQVLSVYHLKRKRQAVQGEDGNTGNTNTTAPPPKRPRSREPELDAYGDLNDF